MKTVTIALVVSFVKVNLTIQVYVISNHGSKVNEMLYEYGPCSKVCVKRLHGTTGIGQCGEVGHTDDKDEQWNICPPSNVRMDPKSIESTASEITGHITINKGRPPRKFLIVPYSYNPETSFIYYPETRSMTPFPRLKTVGVSSVAFVFSRGVVIFISFRKLMYVILRDDKRSPQRVKNVPKIYSVAVDNVQDQIYYGSEQKSVCIGRMLSSFQNATSFYCLRGSHLKAICLDEYRKDVFVGTNTALFKVPYAGQTHELLFRTGFLRCLAFDSKLNQLFYVDRSLLIITSFSTHKKRRIKYHANPSDMLFYKGNLLITFDIINVIKVINVRTRKYFKKKIDSPKPHTFYLCPLQ